MSIEYNWFVAIGCNILAQLVPVGSNNTGTAMCIDNMNYDAISACSGIGLCRTPIKARAPTYSIKVVSALGSMPTSQPQLLDTTKKCSCVHS
jgi:hypothetical protein